MISLSDHQLEVIMRAAAALSEQDCQEFLERVALAVAVDLQMHGQIKDGDVALAVQLALRGLIHNSAVSTREGGQGFGWPLPAPSWQLGAAWRLSRWHTKLRNWATLVFAGARAWGKNKLLSQVMSTLDNFNAMLAHGLGRLLPGQHRE